MAKKSEAVLSPEETQVTSSFVATFWDQFEQSQERALKRREDREDAYLNAVREVIKFNKQYRKAFAKLYEQTMKTNKEMVSEVIHQFNSDKEEMNEEVKVEAVHDREELKQQLKEVSGQLEALALTPIKSIAKVIDQVEDNFEKNVESNIDFSRNRRNAWFEVRKGYVELAKNTHFSLIERGRNSLNEFVKPR